MIIWLLLSAHGILFVSHDLRVESLALEALRWGPCNRSFFDLFTTHVWLAISA
jgi:hypothetical protein